MPWHEPDDFVQLLALAQDREEMPGDYETWRRNATEVINAWRARGGRALGIVTVRPEEFLAWLGARSAEHGGDAIEIRRRKGVELFVGGAKGREVCQHLLEAIAEER